MMGMWQAEKNTIRYESQAKSFWFIKFIFFHSFHFNLFPLKSIFCVKCMEN